MRLDTPSGPAASAGADKGKAKAKGVTIQDGSDDEDDAAAGPREGEFAPNGDADYFVEEDEDGRFLCVVRGRLLTNCAEADAGRCSGGGLSTVQKEVLSIMEGTGNDEQLPGEDLTPQSVRKQLLNLEKAVNKNRDLRTRYPSDPEKFVDSEFNLLEAIRAVFLFSTAPALAYPLMLENSTPNTFADLLSHENMDVPIAVVEVLEELLDPEDLEEVDEDEEDAEAAVEKKRGAMKALLDGLVEAGVIDLVVAQLQRVNEEDEGERNGLFHTLSTSRSVLSSFAC